MPENHLLSIFKKPFLYGSLAFLLVFIITQTITYQSFQLLQKNEQQKVQERVLKLKEDFQNVLGQSFAATQTLAFIVDHYGIPDNFDSIAQLLLNGNKKVDALELVNGEGIITHVYPLKNNNVLGLNILKDSIGKAGAITTLERKRYFTAGPIYLNQGGTGFIGRSPLFKEGEFNGFVAAVVRLSTVIDAVQLDSMADNSFSYQLVKVNPDKTEEVYFSSHKISREDAKIVPLSTSQGEWKLYVIHNIEHSYATVIIFFIFGLLLSIVCGILVWLLMRQPYRLTQLVNEKTSLLQESQENYRELIEQASDAILVSDIFGAILETNFVGVEMLGYTNEELKKKNLSEIIHPEDLKNTPLKYAELKKGKSVLSEGRLVRKDGSVFYSEVSAKLLPNKTIQAIIRDVTKRKLVENENQKLVSIIENSQSFIGLATLNGTPIYINDEGKKLVGFPPEKDLSSTTIFDFFPKEFAETTRKEYLPSLFETGIWNMEVPFVNFKTDDIIPVQFSCFLVHDKGTNEPIGIGCVALDLTEHKKSRQEILELQAKMNAAIRIGKIGYWNWCLDSDTVEWSDEMYTIHEVDKNTEVTLQMATDFLHPDDLYIHHESLNRSPEDDQSKPIVYRICLKNNTIKYLLGYSELQFNKKGQPMKFHGTVMDITKNFLAEESLKETREKFTKAFQTNLMGMLMLDEERKVSEANKTAYSILNTTEKKLLGKTVLESGSVKMDESERERLWNKFGQKGALINEELKIHLLNGQTKSLLISMETLIFNDKKNYLVNIIDNSKRKEAEENLEKQYIELKKTNSELDSFVYSASHELRAPLSSILGLIQLILSENIEPNLVLHLNMMEKSVERLDDFIKDIIEYSRNKHVSITLESINFNDLIENSLENLWYLENSHKIKMKVNVDDNIDFVSDSKRISILLNNFISNAIKYHDVSKDSPSIWIDVTTTEKEAIIKIKDNGVGMAEDQLNKIFDMFYRVSSKIMGTGIGLYIVKEILTKLNGTIDVKSALGEGSTFTLKIPNDTARN
jgi:PAS domain S-box-containing protein